MSDTPTLYRVTLRELAAKALRDKKLANGNVFTAFNWPVKPDVLPVIWISCPGDSGRSNGAGPPDFTRSAKIALRVVVSANRPDLAQNELDTLVAQIQKILMTDHDLQAAITEVSSFEEENKLDAENAPCIAESRMLLGLDYIETWPLLDGEEITNFELGLKE